MCDTVRSWWGISNRGVMGGSYAHKPSKVLPTCLRPPARSARGKGFTSDSAMKRGCVQLPMPIGIIPFRNKGPSKDAPLPASGMRQFFRRPIRGTRCVAVPTERVPRGRHVEKEQVDWRDFYCELVLPEGGLKYLLRQPLQRTKFPRPSLCDLSHTAVPLSRIL